LNVLFVCHANTSRSIMAETLLRHMVQERGFARAIKVHSAGVAPFARDGALVSLDTRFALRDHGIELADGKTSTALKRNLHLLETADLVLAMTADQKAIVERFPQAAGKTIHTLREFAGDGGDIADPASRDESFFRETCALIKQALEKALPRLLQVSALAPQASEHDKGPSGATR
jgi:protein-tyrosine-phosphatase